MLLLGITIIGIPQVVVKYPWGLPVPIQNAGAVAMVLVAGASLFLSIARRSISSMPKPALLLVFILLYSIVLGVLHSEQRNFFWYYFARELWFFAMCFSGIAIALSWPRHQVLQLTEEVNITASLLLLLFSLLLKFGIVGEKETGVARILDISLYAYISAILITLPGIVRNSVASSRCIITMVVLSFGSVLFFSVISGTRSTFLQLIVVMALVGVISARRYKVQFASVLQALLGIGVVCAVIIYGSDFSILTTRLGDTQLIEEIRYVELMDLFAQSNQWFPFGAGIGVGFETAVSDGFSDDGFGGLVNAPHIGIITWMVKAGLFGAAFTLILIALSIVAVLESKRSIDKTMHMYAGLFVLLSIGSSSGGWTMLELFFTGLCVGWGVKVRGDAPDLELTRRATTEMTSRPTRLQQGPRRRWPSVTTCRT
jgi:hypothetical protein